jgi:hypothetical protein
MLIFGWLVFKHEQQPEPVTQMSAVAGRIATDRSDQQRFPVILPIKGFQEAIAFRSINKEPLGVASVDCARWGECNE